MNYCYKCGEKLTQKECFNCGISEGLVPFCRNCNEFRFPIFNSAVSMIVFNNNYSKILLIKQYGRDKNILVAGYVNRGETLEEAVVRELREETSLEVESMQFNASKFFEMSNSLLNNFIVQTKDENFALSAEVDSARWYSVEDALKEIWSNTLGEYFLKRALIKKNIKITSNSELFVTIS